MEVSHLEILAYLESIEKNYHFGIPLTAAKSDKKLLIASDEADTQANRELINAAMLKGLKIQNSRFEVQFLKDFESLDSDNFSFVVLMAKNKTNLKSNGNILVCDAPSEILANSACKRKFWQQIQPLATKV